MNPETLRNFSNVLFYFFFLCTFVLATAIYGLLLREVELNIAQSAAVAVPSGGVIFLIGLFFATALRALADIQERLLSSEALAKEGLKES